MHEPLDVAATGPIQVWTINLPGTGNAITDAGFLDALEAAVHAANADTTTRAVILTGAGRIFSAGGNVRDMAEGHGVFGLHGAPQRTGYTSGIQRIPRVMAQCEVPVIAAINGAAVGAGCDLAMMCDLRIAADTAFFAESFVQLGLIPGDGGCWFLPRIIGPERAAEMTFTGDRVDAHTALQWGMVSRVVSGEELLPQARHLASRIAKNRTQALRMAKRLLLESRQSSLESLLTLSAAMQPLAHQDPEHRERVTRWAEANAKAPAR